MPAPLIWAGLALAGVAGTGWMFREAGDAAESATKLAKWAAVGGVVYVSVKAMKATGVLK